MKTITRENILRMVDVPGARGGGSGVSGSQLASLFSGMADQAWVDEKYLSKDFFNAIFNVTASIRTLVTDPSTTPATVISDTTDVLVIYPNQIPEGGETTDATTGYVTTVTVSIDNIQVNGGLWTNSYVSALGQNSSGGGGGGGSTTLAGLLDVEINNPSNGQALVYNATLGKWVNAAAAGGSVSLIQTGTGLTGGPITSIGTIAISEEYLGYINHGQTAYSWGNHANAGYLTASALNGYATEAWVDEHFNYYVHPTGGADKTISPENGRVLSGIIVNEYGHVTDVTSKILTPADIPSLDASKITSGTFAFARMPVMYWANLQVSSSSSDNTSPIFNNANFKGVINGGRAIYFNILNPSTTHGGFLDFHFAGANDYTTRLMESESGVLRLYGKLRIGNAVLEWDSTNACLKINTGLYSESFVSALGANNIGGGGGGASALYELVDVKPNNDQNPTAVYGQADGKVLMYNASYGKWLAGNITSGTVTSVGMSVPTGLSVSPNAITTSGIFAVSLVPGYVIPLSTDVQKGVTAYGWGNHATAGYLKASALVGYATESWVEQNFNYYVHPTNGANVTITEATGRVLSAITVNEYGHVTSVESKILTSADIPSLDAAKIATGTLDFARLPELYWADVRVSTESDVTTNPTFAIITATQLKIGNGILEWDSNNNCFKLTGGLYATGFLSALGMESGSPGQLSLATLNVTSQLNIIGNGVTHTLTGDANGNLDIASDVFLKNLHTKAGSYVHTSRLYLDATRYIYISGGNLYYFNGTQSKQIAFV